MEGYVRGRIDSTRSHGSCAGLRARSDVLQLNRCFTERGDALAFDRIGCSWRDDFASANDDTNAVRMYRLAVTQNCADAQCDLGLMYRDGRGVEMDDLEAVRLFRLAAEQKHLSAISHLGWMVDAIIIVGVIINYIKIPCIVAVANGQLLDGGDDDYKFLTVGCCWLLLPGLGKMVLQSCHVGRQPRVMGADGCTRPVEVLSRTSWKPWSFTGKRRVQVMVARRPILRSCSKQALPRHWMLRTALLYGCAISSRAATPATASPKSATAKNLRTGAMLQKQDCHADYKYGRRCHSHQDAKAAIVANSELTQCIAECFGASKMVSATEGPEVAQGSSSGRSDFEDYASGSNSDADGEYYER